MNLVCAWCNRFLGIKDGEGTSHGMCEECFEKRLETV